MIRTDKIAKLLIEWHFHIHLHYESSHKKRVQQSFCDSLFQTATHSKNRIKMCNLIVMRFSPLYIFRTRFSPFALCVRVFSFRSSTFIVDMYLVYRMNLTNKYLRRKQDANQLLESQNILSGTYMYSGLSLVHINIIIIP